LAVRDPLPEPAADSSETRREIGGERRGVQDDSRPQATSLSLSDEVARHCKASTRGTRRLLDALASLGFLDKENGRCSLTPESAAFLVTTSLEYLGGFVQHSVRNLLPTWQQLESVVRTLNPAKNLDVEQEGAAFFHDFVPALFAMSRDCARVLAEMILRERGAGHMEVLDVGAGSGVFGMAFAATNANARVTAADWKDVLDVARKIACKAGVIDRFSFAERDLFESDFGSGFSVATLGNLLHMEGPERCQTLLRKVYRSLAPGGTVAIPHYIVPPHSGSSGRHRH
jgi:hypothetical protein